MAVQFNVLCKDGELNKFVLLSSAVIFAVVLNGLNSLAQGDCCSLQGPGLCCHGLHHRNYHSGCVHPWPFPRLSLRLNFRLGHGTRLVTLPPSICTGPGPKWCVGSPLVITAC